MSQLKAKRTSHLKRQLTRSKNQLWKKWHNWVYIIYMMNHRLPETPYSTKISSYFPPAPNPESGSILGMRHNDNSYMLKVKWPSLTIRHIPFQRIKMHALNFRPPRAERCRYFPAALPELKGAAIFNCRLLPLIIVSHF